MTVYIASSDITGNNYKTFIPSIDNPIKMYITAELAIRSIENLRVGMLVKLYCYTINVKNCNLITFDGDRNYCIYTVPITLFGRVLEVIDIGSDVITKEV